MRKALLSVLVLGLATGCEISQPLIEGAQVAAVQFATEGVTSLIGMFVDAFVTVIPV
jgi:hypothetical protein